MPVTAYQSLMAITRLRQGRSEAKEGKDHPAVERSFTQRQFAHMPTVIQVMVLLQLLSDCRPGEIIILRPGELLGVLEVFPNPNHLVRLFLS